MIKKLESNDHIAFYFKINEIIDAINRIQKTLDIEFLLDGPEPPIIEPYENEDGDMD